MLDTTPSNLISEADSAIAFRDMQLRELKNVTNIFTGPFSHAKGGETWPDNFVFQYVGLALPRTAYNNPRFKVKSAQSAPKRIIEMVKRKIQELEDAAMSGMVDPAEAMQQLEKMDAILEDVQRPNMVADAMQWGLNQWLNKTYPDDDVLHFVLNCLVMYGVMKTVRTEKGDKSRPQWQNVSPNRFGFDPLCLMFGGARYMFEQIIRDKDDILDEAERDDSWDKEVVAGLAVDSEASTLRQNSGVANAVPMRSELTYIEFWVREDLPESEGPDAGFNGTLYTVAKNAGSYLRKPRPYYGPPCGPWVMGGVYPVLDSPMPLSPIMANYAQAREHNDQVRAAMAAAKNYKRVVFVPAGSPDVQKKVAESPHDYIIPVKGLKKDEVIQFEVGGVSDQQLQQVAFSREILRRSSGMTENAAGQQEGGGVGKSTATEAAIIDESSDTRMAFVQQRISSAIACAGRSAGWFLYHDDKTEIPLGDEAGEVFDMIRPHFVGGKDEKDGDYDDISVEVDVMSMPWSGQNQEKQNAVALLDQIIKVAPLVATAPQIDWVDALNRVGDAFNESDLGEIVKQDEMQAQLQQQQAAIQGQQQPPQQPGMPAGGGGPPMQPQPPGGSQIPMQGRMVGAQAGAARKQVA